MAFQLGPSVAVLLTLIIFFLCLLTFVGVPHTDLPQDNSRLLKYPTWHPPLIGRDDNKTDSCLFFASLFITFGCIITAKATANPPTSQKLQSVFVSETEHGPKKVSAYGFNRLIILYSFITMLTLLTIIFFDVGKFWVALGITHNASEFTVLVLIGSGGKIRSNLFLGLLCCYWFFVYLGCLFIEWPFDAVWFKFQGLCFDYALMITFIRIYINTKQKLKNYNHENVPLTRDDVHHDGPEPHHPHDQSHDHTHDLADEYEVIPYPRQLLLLILASVFHNIGNLTATISFDELIPSLLTTLTYAVTYPAYLYYVYVDSHSTSIYPQKLIYLPSTPGWKKFIIATISICCSLLTVRLGAFLQARKDNHGDDITAVYY